MKKEMIGRAFVYTASCEYTSVVSATAGSSRAWTSTHTRPGLDRVLNYMTLLKWYIELVAAQSSNEVKYRRLFEIEIIDLETFTFFVSTSTSTWKQKWKAG